ncbi:MAG: helix-turn-helix transcriptional regulator [Acidobacteria bacterium]|nr:helix-turn-helix transcriptional regulator [Acidobacteriota bacterium]
MSYGQMVRQWRSTEGKTQRQLADEIGCSDSYIAHLENEVKLPSLDVCLALAEVLHLPPEEQQALLAAVETARHQSAERRMRTRGATVRRALRTRGVAGEPPPPALSVEELARELAADAELQAAYHDLKTALEAPAMRQTVLQTLRAFAQMARSSGEDRGDGS